MSPAGGHHRVGSLPQLPLGGASTLSESRFLGPSAPSAQRPTASPTSSLASGPTCSSCPILAIFLSSGTTSCVLVSRGALGLRTPSPCGDLLPAFLPLGAPGPSSISQCPPPSFWKTQTIGPRASPALVSPVRPVTPVSCPGPVAVLAMGWPLEAPEAQPGSLCFHSCNQRDFSSQGGNTGEQPACGRWGSTSGEERRVLLPGSPCSPRSL